jgi:hypothetical protein
MFQTPTPIANRFIRANNIAACQPQTLNRAFRFKKLVQTTTWFLLYANNTKRDAKLDPCSPCFPDEEAHHRASATAVTPVTFQ